MGFRVPLDAWFRRDLASYTREILMAENAFCRRFFRSEAISTMLDQQASGIGNHGDRIWSLLFLETWGRRTLAG
jgi:asparagine synthase (glutamine-hydrolysing)